MHLRWNACRSHRQRISFSRDSPFPSASSVSSSWCGKTFDPEREGAAKKRSEHEEAINITLFQRCVKCPRSERRTRSEIVAELCIAGAFCEWDALIYVAPPHLVAFELSARCEFSRGDTTYYFELLTMTNTINAVSHFYIYIIFRYN